MIRIMLAQDLGRDKKILFKLTEPTDELDGEMGEYVPDKAVKLGLGGNIFRALGYKWRGGNEDAAGNHRFWYRNVEDPVARFKAGPLYMEMILTPDKKTRWKITSCKRFIPQLAEGEGVLALPLVEKVEV